MRIPLQKLRILRIFGLFLERIKASGYPLKIRSKIPKKPKTAQKSPKKPQKAPIFTTFMPILREEWVEDWVEDWVEEWVEEWEHEMISERCN